MLRLYLATVPKIKLGSVNEDQFRAKRKQSADAKLIGGFEWRSTAAADDRRTISACEWVSDLDATLRAIKSLLTVGRGFGCRWHGGQPNTEAR